MLPESGSPIENLFTRMKKHLFIILFLVLPGSLTADEQSVLRIGGSDLFAESFQDAVERFAQTEELEIQVALRGSYAGRTALDREELDFAILAVPAKLEEHLEGYESFVFAYQSVVFATHPDNPLNELTLSQVAGIFGAEEQTSYRRWEDLGVGGELRPRSIQTFSIAPGQSIAVDLFTHEVLRNPSMRGGISYLDSMEALLEAVRDSSPALALLPRNPPPDSPVRTVSISSEEGDIAFGPSPENIHNGDYPIRLPVYLVFREEVRGQVRDLLVFLTRDEVAETVEESGLYPLPGSARNRLRLDFEQF